MEVLGDEYISQHIYNERYKEMMDLGFKVYVTDALKAFVGMEKRWYSSIENLEKPQKPQPSIDELVAMVKAVK